jgi:hypothetical protein
MGKRRTNFFLKKCLRKLVWLTSDEIFSRRSLKNPTTTAGQNYYYYYFFPPCRKSVSDFVWRPKTKRLFKRESVFVLRVRRRPSSRNSSFNDDYLARLCNGNLVFLFSLNFWKKFTSAISNFPSGGVHTSGVKKRIAL